MLPELPSLNERGRVNYERRHSDAHQRGVCDSRDSERAALASSPDGPGYVRLRLAHATRVRQTGVSWSFRNSPKRASSGWMLTLRPRGLLVRRDVYVIMKGRKADKLFDPVPYAF